MSSLNETVADFEHGGVNYQIDKLLDQPGVFALFEIGELGSAPNQVLDFICFDDDEEDLIDTAKVALDDE